MKRTLIVTLSTVGLLLSPLVLAESPASSKPAPVEFMFQKQALEPPPMLKRPTVAKGEPSITCLTMLTSVADVDASMITAAEVDDLEVAQRAMRVARADLLRTAIALKDCRCREAASHFETAGAWAKKSVGAKDYRVFGRFYDESVNAYRLGAKAITTCDRKR
jgi:hypothetical protein